MTGGYLVGCAPSSAELRQVIKEWIDSGKIINCTVEDIMLNGDFYCVQMRESAKAEWHQRQVPRLQEDRRRYDAEMALEASSLKAKRRQAAEETAANQRAQDLQLQQRRSRK